MSGDIIPSKSGIVVLTGYGISVSVERGHLLVNDGIGKERRSARFGRVDAKALQRLVVIGYSGFISFEAVRFLCDTGIAFLQLDYDANILMCAAPIRREAIQLRRAQAIAPYTETGLAITRYLLEQKLQGQAKTSERIDRQTSTDIQRLGRQLADVHTIDEMRSIEGYAAALYWPTFAARSFPFIQRDTKNVPGHWRTIGARISPLTNSPRKAVTPFHAMLNYLYALLEGETTIALQAMGFDPALGILHTDIDFRASFACDVMEVVRPDVDRWLLDTIATRTFTAKDFIEARDGQCRLLPSITGLLAETIPLWRRTVAPIIEHIAVLLAGSAIPTVLTGQKRAAARPQNNGKPKPKREPPITLPRKCKRCGEVVPKARRVFCSEVCRVRYQGEKLAEAKEQLSDTATWYAPMPDQPVNGSAPRAADISVEMYRNEIAPALANVPIATIRSATGLSRSYCKLIKRGKIIPHSSHWGVLKMFATSENTR